MKYSMKKLSVLLGLFLGTHSVDVLSSEKTFKINKSKEATEVSEKVENFLLDVCCLRRRRRKVRRIDKERLMDLDRLCNKHIEESKKVIKKSEKARKEAKRVIEEAEINNQDQIEQKNKAAEGFSEAD